MARLHRCPSDCVAPKQRLHGHRSESPAVPSQRDVAFSVDAHDSLQRMNSADATLLLALPTLPPRSEMERAFAARDTAYDGVFFVAVRTTGIFCRPSCPSRPQPANVEFLPSIRDCLTAGYRACKRCHPDGVTGTPPNWVTQLMQRLADSPNGRITAADLRALDVTPERARRWFRTHHGMSFAAWCRGHRLSAAFQRIRQGDDLDDAGLDAGFESQSGFREAFSRAFGDAPGRVGREAVADHHRVVVRLLESPIGPLLVGARDAGICLLEFADRRRLDSHLAKLAKQFEAALVPGDHPQLTRLAGELGEYFAGARREFSVPLLLHGTAFQVEVWNQLRGIPYGATISYETLAQRVGRPTGQRAVARANGDNRISILIPCHRVIGKDGQLTGYGGGLWRKRLLLELEHHGRLPT